MERLYDELGNVYCFERNAKPKIGKPVSTSADKLDELDNKRASVKQFELGVWWAAIVLCVSAALIIGGAAVMDVLPFVGSLGLAALWVGIVAGFMSMLFGVVWFRGWFIEGTPYGDRDEAQKDYNRALRRDAEEFGGKS